MFFIAGTKGETTTFATGEFYCPECNAHTQYHHDQVHEKIMSHYEMDVDHNCMHNVECRYVEKFQHW